MHSCTPLVSPLHVHSIISSIRPAPKNTDLSLCSCRLITRCWRLHHSILTEKARNKPVDLEKIITTAESDLVRLAVLGGGCNNAQMYPVDMNNVSAGASEKQDRRNYVPSSSIDTARSTYSVDVSPIQQLVVRTLLR